MTLEQLKRKRKVSRDSDGSFSDEDTPLSAKLELRKTQKKQDASDSDDGDDVPLLRFDNSPPFPQNVSRSIVQGPSPKEPKSMPRPEKTPKRAPTSATKPPAKALSSPTPNSAEKKAATPVPKVAERPKHVPADFATIRAKVKLLAVCVLMYHAGPRGVARSVGRGSGYGD